MVTKTGSLRTSPASLYHQLQEAMATQESFLVSTQKSKRPQQDTEELPTMDSGSRWITSSGLAAGTSPAHSSRDFEFHHQV